MSLNSLVTDTLELLAYALRVDNITMHLDLAGELPLLWADTNQIQQVITNLITNAHQALRESSALRELTLTTRCDPMRTRVTLTVTDTGPGVPPVLQAHIFEPFFTTKPVGIGTGLGLSLCQGIIERHGGTITVTSQPGRVLPSASNYPLRLSPRQCPSLRKGTMCLLYLINPS